jgi:hypothetical protein
MIIATIAILDIYRAYSYDCTITSANDSRHSAKSKHYEGCALDFRTKDAGMMPIPKHVMDDIVQDIKDALNDIDFDVVLESDHLHVEYDPK